MKRIFTYLASIILMGLTVSCQKDLAPQGNSADDSLQTVSFVVSAPENTVATKAISDGKSVDKLEYAVYRSESYKDSQGNEYAAGEYIASLSEGENASIVSITTEDGVPAWEVTLTLAKNVKYDIVFWAQNSEAPYAFDKAAKTITVTDDYKGEANDETRDAFFHRCEDYIVVTTETKVELRRPFAQINFGSSDYDPYITSMNFNMSSTLSTEATVNVPTVLNVLDGSVSGGAPLAFKTSSIPYENGDKDLTEINGTKYYWVGMNYVLAGEESTINLKGTFEYNGGSLDIEVPSVPYKRNYKTNIIGDLFTGEAKFEVVVVPDYSEGDKNTNIDDIKFTLENGGSYALSSNMDLSEALVLNSGKDVTIDLNGNTITGGIRPEESTSSSAAVKSSTKPEWSLGILVENGTLTIKDSKGEGKIVTEDATYSIPVWVKGNGVVNIEGGYFQNAGDGCEVIYASGSGKAYISGGYFKPTKKVGVEDGTANPYTALNVRDADYKAGTASISVTGGKFYGFDPANNVSEGAGTSFVAEGYESVKSAEADADGVYEWTVSEKVVVPEDPGEPEETDYTGDWFFAHEVVVATAISSNYGYMPTVSAWTKDKAIAGGESSVFSIAAVEGGYSIQDANGKYLYAGQKNDSSYFNSFNLSTAFVADNAAYVWTIEANDDGTYTITNTASNFVMGYTSYGSFGTYEAGASNILGYPVLVKAETVMPAVSIDASSVSFTAEGGSKTVTVTADKTISVKASIGENFSASVDGMVVTVTAAATTEAKSDMLFIDYEYEGYGTDVSIAVSQSAPVSGNATEVTLSMADIDQERGTSVTEVTSGEVTVTYDQGANTNNGPKLYDGSVRAYVKNTITVSASGNSITAIEIAYESKYEDDSTNGTNNPMIVDCGNYSSGQWTGVSDQVVFTIGPENRTSGQRRITSIKVTYSK